MPQGSHGRDVAPDDALRMAMTELGDEWCSLLFVDADQVPYIGITSVTWLELVRRCWFLNRGLKRYQMTAAGWIEGVRLLGMMEQAGFRAKASNLALALGRHTLGSLRKDPAFVDVYSVARESGVSVGFVRNAVSSHLLESLFGWKGPFFVSEDKELNYVVVPMGCGAPRMLRD